MALTCCLVSSYSLITSCCLLVSCSLEGSNSLLACAGLYDAEVNVNGDLRMERKKSRLVSGWRECGVMTGSPKSIVDKKNSGPIGT